MVLHHLQPRLAAVGVLYPRVAPRSAPASLVNHQPFGETLDGRRPRRERAECLDALSAALARTDADTVILSYEDFALQHPRFGVPEVLRGALAQHGFAMEVAIVVKAPSDQLTSLYAHRAQLVRETRPFGEFARSVWRGTRFDYGALLDPWSAAVDGRVTAVPVRDRRSDAPLIERVFSALGLQERIGGLLDPTDRMRVENRSSGPIAVEVSRRLCRMRARQQVKDHPPRDIGRFIDGLVRSRGWDAETFRGDDPDILRRIDAHHAASSERFARAVWAAPWATVVGETPRLPPNELAGRPIPPEVEARVASVVTEAISRFGLRRLPDWWCASAELAEAAALRIAPLLGYRGWRVSP